MKKSLDFSTYLDNIDRCRILESGNLNELQKKYGNNKKVIVFPFNLVNYDKPCILMANGNLLKIGGERELTLLKDSLEESCMDINFQIKPADYIFTAVEFND